MSHLSAEFIDEMKQALLQKQQQLKQELSGILPHTEEGQEMDENAQEVAEDEVNQDVIATIKSDLEKIEKALVKIQSGTYGLDDSGREINPERLKVLPWADTAI